MEGPSSGSAPVGVGSKRSMPCAEGLAVGWEGYIWLKYGEKRLSRKGKLRSYFKCSRSKDINCKAKKWVDSEGSTCDEAGGEVTIMGAHNHPDCHASPADMPPLRDPLQQHLLACPPQEYLGSALMKLLSDGLPGFNTVGSQQPMQQPIPVLRPCLTLEMAVGHSLEGGGITSISPVDDESLAPSHSANEIEEGSRVASLLNRSGYFQRHRIRAAGQTPLDLRRTSSQVQDILLNKICAANGSNCNAPVTEQECFGRNTWHGELLKIMLDELPCSPPSCLVPELSSVQHPVPSSSSTVAVPDWQDPSSPLDSGAVSRLGTELTQAVQQRENVTCGRNISVEPPDRSLSTHKAVDIELLTRFDLKGQTKWDWDPLSEVVDGAKGQSWSQWS